jgi:transposase-like protein
MMTEQVQAVQGIEGARRATEIPWGGLSAETISHRSADPEVSAKASRRRFTADYKIKIIRQADACSDSKSLGALLRREGLYASNLTTWRNQRDRGVLTALSPKKRGRKESGSNPLQVENEKLRKENNRLERRLKRAELIIDIQKKAAQILGIPLSTPEEGEND